MNYPEVTYIVYDSKTFKIHDTFAYWGKDLMNLCNATNGCVINVTHPAAKDILNKIIEANK